jgi:hypothetical protein
VTLWRRAQLRAICTWPHSCILTYVHAPLVTRTIGIQGHVAHCSSRYIYLEALFTATRLKCYSWAKLNHRMHSSPPHRKWCIDIAQPLWHTHTLSLALSVYILPAALHILHNFAFTYLKFWSLLLFWLILLWKHQFPHSKYNWCTGRSRFYKFHYDRCPISSRFDSGRVFWGNGLSLVDIIYRISASICLRWNHLTSKEAISVCFIN